MSKSCYHYTSIEALYNIVTNKSLHFGSFGMMNDPLETKVDDELLREAYANEFSEAELPPEFYFKRSNTDEFQYVSFGFSTSKIEDDLTQWRSYTQKGLGVCIEFDQDELEKQVFKLLRDDKAVSHECVYREEEKRDLFIKYVQSVRDNNWYKSMNRSHPQFLNHIHFASNYITSLQEMAIQMKHESFRAESEVRFFIFQDSFNGDIKIKPCSLGLTRYVCVPITPECIKSIRTGPLVDKRNSFMISDLFFSNMGKLVEVTETASPYV
ncbi:MULTISPECIES: DUF2971 domain-containing protein [unclassified Agarivorans]|uniref:DUF2971 domain-containing protein n=1 Tax=unclassified Agarivorans TaxID=2636026 RepID=UPI0026E11C42|nr:MULTISPECIES: DUF2971 domain-containing protein [unclassified Agarivorans]MDO6688086.1 DUF2971 domain-containing protein [Agarivorans sp. 3_MG-2023]MDO6717681.1 DUF2971 domain-containing protein [Agarivorans sp. 2_MG-2023]